MNDQAKKIYLLLAIGATAIVLKFCLSDALTSVVFVFIASLIVTAYGWPKWFANWKFVVFLIVMYGSEIAIISNISFRHSSISVRVLSPIAFMNIFLAAAFVHLAKKRGGQFGNPMPLDSSDSVGDDRNNL